MSEHLLVEREQGLLTLCMHRPDKKNALTRAMYSGMAEVLVQADQDKSVRAVLITGGDSCFTSGNDVADFIQAPPTGLNSEVFQFMQALFEFSKPVVAAVNGPAVGIGTTMLLHCDLVYVSRDATLKMPFVNLGLCPEYGSSLILPRLLGGHMLQRALGAQKRVGARACGGATGLHAVQAQREARRRRLAHARPRRLAQTARPAWSVRSTCSGVIDTQPWATAWKSVPWPASRASPAGPIQ